MDHFLCDIFRTIIVNETIEEKRPFSENDEFFIINTKTDLDRWFQFYSSDFKIEHPVDFIFRGMSDAKYKLFTSAQRLKIKIASAYHGRYV